MLPRMTIVAANKQTTKERRKATASKVNNYNDEHGEMEGQPDGK